ncbi:MAG: hypothetical protein A4S09_02650 [Proteobacteria bacterium SG_bin7]|nr:MAG: hypothetical protein A4S09_02650 [Proteobacteria bacterium SG_bin7]
MQSNNASLIKVLPENWFTREVAKHSGGRRVLKSLGYKLARRNLGDFNMDLDLADRWGVSKYILRHGSYDSDLCNLVKSKIRANSVCVDIGANIGFWTNFLVSSCRALQVFAVEPEPKNLFLLKRNIELNNNQDKVKILPYALGEKEGRLGLYLSKDNAGDHQLYQTAEVREKIDVEVFPLDTLLPEIKIDFLKIDVQGYESYVFKGMKQLIEQSKNMAVLMEFWPAAIKRAGGDPLEILSMFQAQDFTPYIVDTQYSLKKIKMQEISAYVPGDHHVDVYLTRI